MTDGSPPSVIDTLIAAKSGYFYDRQRRMTDKAIADAFKLVRQQARNPSQNLFRHDRVTLDGSRWSALAFYHDRDPAFLDPAPAIKERVCGFLLIVERGSMVAVFKSGLDLPITFKSTWLRRVPDVKVEAALAHEQARFEKIRLRNMSISSYALRTKSLEANDLQNAVGPSGASRFVPQSYSLNRDDGHYSATPNTGRIAHRADKAGHVELVRWASTMIDELEQCPGEVSAFIKAFARPVDLGSLAQGVRPTYLSINAAQLAEDVLDLRSIRFVRAVEDGFEALDKAEASAVISSLDATLEVHSARNGALTLRAEGGRAAVGAIRMNKSRIALRDLRIGDVTELFVESTAFAAGEDDDRAPLRSYLDANDRFIVLFNDLALVYVEGGLFRDDQLAAGGPSLLSYLQTEPLLARSTSEKGGLVDLQPAFDLDSVFSVVATRIASADDVLVCDDLGDEWADFIGLRTGSDPKTISFYHAKHGGLSLGASPFHVSVSQAMKNVGRLALPPEDVGRKIEGWSRPYANFGIAAAMPRILRGDRAAVETAVAEARAAPDTMRRVFIVTSSLSKAAVAETLRRLADGIPAPPHFVQLYWLLMSYFSACQEVGAYGYVICQD